jgi:hypothetical protein
MPPFAIWWNCRARREEAIHMASLHPARLLGIDDQLGSLAAGKRANVIALDGGLHLQQIWIQGQALPFSPFIMSHCWPYDRDRKAFLFLSFILSFSITLFVLFLFLSLNFRFLSYRFYLTD